MLCRPVCQHYSGLLAREFSVKNMVVVTKWCFSDYLLTTILCNIVRLAQLRALQPFSVFIWFFSWFYYKIFRGLGE